jgi:small subunit ribosomal protein S2
MCLLDKVLSGKQAEEKQKGGTDMSYISMKNLLEAGVHFGHQTKRWNPKMSKYVFGARNGIYILDLQKTVQCFNQAYEFVRDASKGGNKFLFVGTKKQAQEAIKEAADKCGAYYVNQRWLGGMLTNFETIKGRISRLKELEDMFESGYINRFTKKEQAVLRREFEKLTKNLSGIKEMTEVPDIMFVIDIKLEQNAISEAHKLGIPVVAIVDTNCDPDLVDFPIPGNDDAIRACQLIAVRIADAILEGKQLREENLIEEIRSAGSDDVPVEEIVDEAELAKELTSGEPEKKDED